MLADAITVDYETKSKEAIFDENKDANDPNNFNDEEIIRR